MTGKDIFKKYSEGVFGVVEQEKIKASAFTLGAGLYVTVSHPLEDPESIKLRKQNGEDIHAKVLGWDNRYDLAVLEGEWDIESWELEEAQELSPGAPVWSLGFDQHGPRIHQGILSQVRSLWALPMGGEIAPSLEVDGSLSYTMSGGPLFSEAGQLLGMNSLMPRGKGMTLPIQQLQSLAQSIKIRGNPKMGYLGIATTPAQGGGGQRTLVITEIEKGSPASEAGLLVGDQVLELSGMPLSHNRQLYGLLQRFAAGDRLSMKLLRADQEKVLEITLAERK